MQPELADLRDHSRDINDLMPKGIAIVTGKMFATPTAFLGFAVGGFIHPLRRQKLPLALLMTGLTTTLLSTRRLGCWRRTTRQIGGRRPRRIRRILTDAPLKLIDTLQQNLDERLELGITFLQLGNAAIFFVYGLDLTIEILSAPMSTRGA
jgi:hypothetical protein